MKKMGELRGGASLLAFTLAEVLITLAIIGIVAMLTVPSLIISNQEKGWNTASKVFETKLEQALKVMNTQQTLAGYRTTKDFVNELRNHFKITKVCDTLTDCFEDKVYWGSDNKEVDMSKIKTAKNFGQNDWGTETLGVQFGNGTTGVIAYNPDCKQNPYTNQITGTSCLALLYDTNGYQSPNTSGKDLGAINVNKLGRECAFEVGGTCYGTPFIPIPVTKAECEEMRAKKELNHCYYENDYWAGAVKQCNGIENLPTSTQLAEIASEIYGKTVSPTLYKYTFGTRNDERATSYGFKLFYAGSVGIMWLGGEYDDGTMSFARVFYSEYTVESGCIRTSPLSYAVCIID